MDLVSLLVYRYAVDFCGDWIPCDSDELSGSGRLKTFMGTPSANRSLLFLLFEPCSSNFCKYMQLLMFQQCS